MIPLGLYAFKNHDLSLSQDHCFSIQEVNTPVDQNSYPEATDITEAFIFYFLLAFITVCTTMFFFIFVTIARGAGVGWMMHFKYFNFILIFANIGLLVYGTIIRLSHEAKVCSGDKYFDTFGYSPDDVSMVMYEDGSIFMDKGLLPSPYMPSSGNFIAMILYVGYSLMLSGFLCMGCVWAMWSESCKLFNS